MAVARNRPATPVTGHFACDHGQQRLLCGMASVGLYGVHCRISLPDCKVIMTWCTVQVQEIQINSEGPEGRTEHQRACIELRVDGGARRAAAGTFPRTAL